MGQTIHASAYYNIPISLFNIAQVVLVVYFWGDDCKGEIEVLKVGEQCPKVNILDVFSHVPRALRRDFTVEIYFYGCEIGSGGALITRVVDEVAANCETGMVCFELVGVLCIQFGHMLAAC